MLGTDFPYRQFYPEQRAHRADRYPAGSARQPLPARARPASATSRTTLEALLPQLPRRPTRAISMQRWPHYRKAREDLDALAESGPDSSIIHPQYVTRVVSELAAEDAIFTCDVGTPTVWAARYLAMNGKRRLIGSFNHGSMANAMLQAIGAQAAVPEPPGGLAVGRWRLRHDDGRLHHADPDRPAGEGGRAQQRHARLRRDGDEGRRLRSTPAATSRTRTSRPWPRPWASRASASRSRRT